MTEQKTSMAVLFADVSDSTRLYESLGDTAAFGGVRGVLGSLRAVSNAFGGRVVKTIGDGLMCVFPDADSAAGAAVEMQRSIAQRPPLERGKKLTIRVGFHVGPVIQDGDDVFGDCVNVAARMAALALAGQAITTAGTVAALSAHLRETTRPIDALPVKGKSENVEVHELLWQSSSERTVIPGRTPAAAVGRAGAPALRLTHRGQQKSVTVSATFGREPDNSFVITDPMASRRHAKIERRADHFVLMDQSSNGTYVTIGGSEVRLRREEVVLHSSGRIAFGHSTSDANAETVEFDCSVE
ncbi:MAG TPA: adenylate/guanylate cyclase domain-containing protein [Burkholderiales bacterium]|nr:adenylate/guanylate cyclase domain-containing protein [Burkholderiales bacterium]